MRFIAVDVQILVIRSRVDDHAYDCCLHVFVNNSGTSILDADVQPLVWSEYLFVIVKAIALILVAAE